MVKNFGKKTNEKKFLLRNAPVRRHCGEEKLKMGDIPFYFRIKKAITNLSSNPHPSGCKKLVDREGWKIRIGNYRVIYEIFDDQLLIDVIAVGHRKDMYE